MTKRLTLDNLLHTYRPESWGGTRGNTWPQHANYLWDLDRTYMQRLAIHMAKVGGWFNNPVTVDDGVVQDGHHRIITAVELGWHHKLIPVTT